MAYVNSAHNPAHGILSSVYAGIRSTLRGIGRGFVTVMEAQSRSTQLQRLTSMSDAELAERGMKREDIVRHVFADRFYC